MTRVGDLLHLGVQEKSNFVWLRVDLSIAEVRRVFEEDEVSRPRVPVSPGLVTLHRHAVLARNSEMSCSGRLFFASSEKTASARRVLWRRKTTP
jgi:hypothetical protein